MFTSLDLFPCVIYPLTWLIPEGLVLVVHSQTVTFTILLLRQLTFLRMGRCMMTTILPTTTDRIRVDEVKKARTFNRE